MQSSGDNCQKNALQFREVTAEDSLSETVQYDLRSVFECCFKMTFIFYCLSENKAALLCLKLNGRPREQHHYIFTCNLEDDMRKAV